MDEQGREFYHLGSLLIDAGRIDEAILTLKDSLQLVESRVRPEQHLYVSDLALTLYLLARAYRLSGQEKNALAILERSFQLFRREVAVDFQLAFPLVEVSSLLAQWIENKNRALVVLTDAFKSIFPLFQKEPLLFREPIARILASLDQTRRTLNKKLPKEVRSSVREATVLLRSMSPNSP